LYHAFISRLREHEQRCNCDISDPVVPLLYYHYLGYYACYSTAEGCRSVCNELGKRNTPRSITFWPTNQSISIPTRYSWMKQPSIALASF